MPRGPSPYLEWDHVCDYRLAPSVFPEPFALIVKAQPTVMSGIPANPGQPHIVELVLQAKKALQQGQELCLHASLVSAASAQTAVDVLALDAQVRWMSEAVLDQLKVRCHRPT